MLGGEGKSKLVKGLIVPGLPLTERLSRRERKWSGLHLLDAPEAGKLGRFSVMVLFLVHTGLKNDNEDILAGPSIGKITD
jgi:hypothetical protein